MCAEYSSQVSRPEKSNFKDWFDRQAAHAMADQISRAYDGFDSERFVRLTTRGLGALEFKERVQKFARALRESLPEDYVDALSVLVDSLPEPLPDCESPMDGWLQWPIGEFIALYGIEHFDDSFEAMEVLTQVFTAEYAVRPFVLHYPEDSIERFLRLTDHESPHVRRWCSEGLRTRLPWGIVLGELSRQPESVLPILEALKDDPELYVRRSVANNLNDLAKLHPDFVVDVCRRWMESAGVEREWLARQALRTLTKEGHREALALFGYRPLEGRVAVDFTLSPRSVLLGESVTLTAGFHNRSSEAVPLSVELVFHLVRQSDKSVPKIFRWKSFSLPAGKGVQMTKSQKMESNTSRELYSGLHRVELQVNGEVSGFGEFHLI